MKKTALVILLLVCCLVLCSCGKTQAVKEAEIAIGNIGEVTLESEAAIKTAEKLYNFLTDNEKEKVENRKALIDAKEVYEKLLAEQAVKQEEEIYNKAKEAYTQIAAANVLCQQGVRGIYNAWYYSIFNLEDYFGSDERHLSALASKTGVSVGDLKKAMEKLDWTMIYVTLDSSHVIKTVMTAFEVNGVTDNIDKALSEAQKCLKALDDTYSDTKYYPVLKSYYSSVKAYVDFYKNPSGSMRQMQDTISEYESNIAVEEKKAEVLF